MVKKKRFEMVAKCEKCEDKEATCFVFPQNEWLAGIKPQEIPDLIKKIAA